MHPTRRKHGHLKLHIDRRTNPRLGTDGTNQLQIHCEHTLRFPGETFDTPDYGILFGFVFGTSEGVFNFGFGCVFGDGDFNDYVGGEEFFGEVGDYFEIDGASKNEREFMTHIT